ncbi:MAG: sigma factor SigF [Prochlorococcaceae cyanobacterium]
MLFPFLGCGSDGCEGGGRRAYQQRKLRMLSGWRDALERQLAAVNAAISTLEQQIQRDAASEQGS